MSLDLLSILGTRKNYYRFSKFLKLEVLPKETQQIIQDLNKFYKLNESVDVVDWESFGEWFVLVEHSAWKQEKLDTFSNLFTRLCEHEESGVAEAIIEKYVIQEAANTIAELALKGAEGDVLNYDDIKTIINEMELEIGKVNELDDYVVTTDLEAIVNELETGGMKWRTTFLNRSIGDLLPERLVCVAARPNVGKTTFLATEATNFAAQLPDEKCVLWLNNEESGKAVFFRIVQACLQEEEGVLKASPIEALKEYTVKIGRKEKIVLINKADLTTDQIEEYCKKYNPGVIIIDQLWKVHGFEKSSGTDTARLGAIFRWGREIAKRYAPVITVHQLKTEAHHVEYPSMDMLYLSGTVIQGEVDTMIMIGNNATPSQEKLRFMGITKQKMASGSDVDPKLREGRHVLEIVPEKAMFKELEAI